MRSLNRFWRPKLRANVQQLKSNEAWKGNCKANACNSLFRFVPGQAVRRKKHKGGRNGVEEEKKVLKISVRNLVEFVLRSGDIDNRRTSGAEKEAMQ